MCKKLLTKAVLTVIVFSMALCMGVGNVYALSSDEEDFAAAEEAVLKYLHGRQKDGEEYIYDDSTIQGSRAYGSDSDNYCYVDFKLKDSIYGFTFIVERGTNKIISSLGNTYEESKAIAAAVKAAHEEYDGKFKVLDNTAYIAESNDSCYLIFIDVEDGMFSSVYVVQKGIDKVLYSTGMQNFWVGMLEDSFMEKVSLIDSNITVYLNGEKLEFDQEPINQDGSILLPIRAIAEAMGKTVVWNDETKTAVINNADNDLIIPAGEKCLYLGDENYPSSWERIETDVPVQVINGSTVVPMRQFAEGLGAHVMWSNEEKAAYIIYN